MIIGGYEISRAHAHQVAQVAAQDALEESWRVSRAEEWLYRCITTAPAIHEQMQLARAKVDADARRAEVAEQQAQAQRLADFEDWQQYLLRTGQGRWRTVDEVLQAERGVPC